MKIKCHIRFITDSKIKAIKLVRTATGFGLKESKDFVDMAFNDTFDRRYPIPIIVTDAMFGIFESMSRMDEFGPLLSFSGLSIVPEVESIFDFTKVP